MPKNYKELIKGINLRTNPENYQMTKMFSDTLSGSKLYESSGIDYPDDDVVEYVRTAMQGVPEEHTMKTKVAANLVEAQLKKSHGNDVYFARQGSVMTNTHILKDHDIDLLQITNKSSGFDHSGLDIALANPQKYSSDEVIKLKRAKSNFSPYLGKQISDLGKIRLKSEAVLSGAYKSVDISKDNCITVNTTNPERLVDVVVATYYKGVGYLKSDEKKLRGIQIYNKKTDSIGEVDYPFLSIELINVKNISSMRRLKDMIRFLKNVKFDCLNIVDKGAIRSYHINAICYNMELDEYKDLHYLDLVLVLNDELNLIHSNKAYRDSIYSVDGCELIFEKDCDKKLIEIKFLQEELDSILADLNMRKRWVG
jgi:hypothetical protein